MKESKGIDEQERILQAYRDRKKLDRGQSEFFSYESLAHIVRIQERHRKTLRLLQVGGYRNLADMRILDVGCGDGNMLRQFLQWGAAPENLAGIELREEPVEKSHYLNPHLTFATEQLQNCPGLLMRLI